jgi:hypothetical protein
MSSQRHVSVTEHIIFQKLPCVWHSAYNSSEVSFVPSSVQAEQNTTENKSINSHAQDICSIDTNVFLNGIHPLTGHNHLII